MVFGISTKNKPLKNLKMAEILNIDILTVVKGRIPEKLQFYQSKRE